MGLSAHAVPLSTEGIHQGVQNDVTIQVVDPREDPDWDNRISQFKDACFFHSSAWPTVLAEVYQQVPLYFVLRVGPNTTGLLPVMEIRSKLTGTRGVSLSFADLCPPLGLNPQQFRAVLAEVYACGAKRGWKYFEGRGGFELLDQPVSWRQFYGHTLDLTVGEEQLWKSFEGRSRNAMRKAESSGVKVEISHSAAARADFFRLHCDTRRKHGVPPQPVAFFDSIQNHILEREHGIISVAKLDGKAVAAAVFFHFGGKVIYKYSASDMASQQLRPNNLVMWEAIRWYARAGATEMHFGRTSISNEGLLRYKRRFGTSEHAMNYFRYDLRAGAYRAGQEQEPGWKNQFCSRLPLAILRLAGTMLYRHMS